MKPEEVMCISSSEDENRIAGGNKKEYVVYVASSSDDEAALPGNKDYFVATAIFTCDINFRLQSLQVRKTFDKRSYDIQRQT